MDLLQKRTFAQCSQTRGMAAIRRKVGHFHPAQSERAWRLNRRSVSPGVSARAFSGPTSAQTVHAWTPVVQYFGVFSSSNFTAQRVGEACTLLVLERIV
jgi:hypothetical protein